MRIILTIQEHARKRGIERANQLGRACGFAPATAADLWAEDFKRIDLKTLLTLCEVLKTSPGRILRIER